MTKTKKSPSPPHRSPSDGEDMLVTWEQRKLLLRDLTTILNRYQDIEDLLDHAEPSLKKIRRANGEIGKTVAKHLPG